MRGKEVCSINNHEAIEPIGGAFRDPCVMREIERILRDGNTVELKREGGQLVIVEIRRRKKIKQPL